MNVFTKTGDKGETSLYKGGRFLKSEPVFDVLGTLDELNAALSFVSNTRIKELYTNVAELQSDLFLLGSLIANDDPKSPYLEFFAKRTEAFEKTIIKLTKKLPKLTNFILPGGSQDSCHLHLARAICRRLERILVLYAKKPHQKSLIIYVNRLSDLLFTLARFANFKLRVKDVIWKKP